jgi:hypothetical protein
VRVLIAAIVMLATPAFAGVQGTSEGASYYMTGNKRDRGEDREPCRKDRRSRPDAGAEGSSFLAG